MRITKGKKPTREVCMLHVSAVRRSGRGKTAEAGGGRWLPGVGGEEAGRRGGTLGFRAVGLV